MKKARAILCFIMLFLPVVSYSQLKKPEAHPKFSPGRSGKDSGGDTVHLFIDGMDTTRYIGELKNDSMNGKGAVYYPNGDKYVGKLENNRKSGYGVFYWVDGPRYEGSWKNDYRNGQGTMYWPNGEKYVGHFKNGYRDGKGVYYWPNGDVYDGDWVAGKRTGYGTLTIGPKSRWQHIRKFTAYKGHWVNDVKFGQGAWYGRDDKLVKEGWFYQGELYHKPLLKTDSSATNVPLNALFLEPIAIVDFRNGPSVRLGAEKSLGRNWSITGTGGIYVVVKGWMVKGELKKYLHPSEPGYRSYVSVEYFYKQEAYQLSDSILIQPNYLATFTVAKYVSGFRLKYGQVQLLSHKLMVEYYAGGGIRYRNGTSTLSKTQYDNLDYREDDFGIAAYTSAVSKTIRPDITLGVRFGIRR